MTEQKKPQRIIVRSKNLTDSHFYELREFYRNKQKTEPNLVVEYNQEASTETQNYIQITIYGEGDEVLDDLMIPYKE